MKYQIIIIITRIIRITKTKTKTKITIEEI